MCQKSKSKIHVDQACQTNSATFFDELKRVTNTDVTLFKQSFSSEDDQQQANLLLMSSLGATACKPRP